MNDIIQADSVVDCIFSRFNRRYKLLVLPGNSVVMLQA